MNVDAVFRDPTEWTRRSILSTAGMGRFSSDRTIAEYAKDVWHIAPCRRLAPETDALGRVRSFPSLISTRDIEVSGGFKEPGSGSSLKGSTGGLRSLGSVRVGHM